MRALVMSKLGIKKAPYQIALALSLLSLPHMLNASPTSKEYVDKQIKEIFENVQVQLNQQNTTIETKVTKLKHHIGETYQGGVVFWVDESEQHGLIAAKIDADDGQGIQWSNGESGDKTTNAKANGLFAGFTNTPLIISEETMDDQEGRFAALLAANYQVSADGISQCDFTRTPYLPCYGGWYLPSLYELILLHQNLRIINQILSGSYWSSTEYNTTQAWLFNFSSGEQEINDKSIQAHVRAIRNF